MERQIRNNEALCKIAAKLKTLRKPTGKLQKEITQETGMNIGDFESAATNLSVSTLERLCCYYGLTLAEFFDEELGL